MMEIISKYFGSIIFISSLFITSGIFLWKYYKVSENEAKCPKCSKLWAAEKLSEKLVGVFQKGHRTSSLSIQALSSFRSDVKMVRYEKYEIEYRCKYCGHEWKFLKSKRQ